MIIQQVSYFLGQPVMLGVGFFLNNPKRVTKRNTTCEIKKKTQKTKLQLHSIVT